MIVKPTHHRRMILSLILPLCLGISLAFLLAFLTRSPSYGAPSSPSMPAHGSVASAAQGEIWYTRTQVVILHEPPNARIYTTTYTTTYRVTIEGFHTDDPKYNCFNLPSKTITHTALCTPTVPATGTCLIRWNVPAYECKIPNVVFTGTGLADIYLEYDRFDLASRDPSGPTITLQYRVGPADKEFILTNTVFFTRALYGAKWYPIERGISPTNYTYDPFAYRLSWTFMRTNKVTFTIPFHEPLLGSDLVVEDIWMSPTSPGVDDPVRFTVTVRNIGPYTTGRPILTEIFVRPVISGPPTVLTDHRGGWASYYTPTLVKWPPSYTEYWYAGLGPGEAVTGTTVFTWPPECAEPCDVWVKVDPTYIQLGAGYEWYGQNPEGFLCTLDASMQPTCPEENNNLRGLTYRIYLPLIMRNR